MRVRSMLGGAVAVLCFAGPAVAAVDASQVGQRLGYNPNAAKVGVDVEAGVGGLTNSLSTVTNPGPFLGLAAVAQPWRNLGLEVGYQGQRLPIDDPRVGDEQSVFRHNVSIFGKAGPALVNDRVRPFVGAGAGVSYLNVTDGAAHTGLYNNTDWLAEVPVGAGVDFKFGDFIAGARGDYRFLLGENFANPATGGGGNGDLLNFNVTVGGRF